MHKVNEKLAKVASISRLISSVGANSKYRHPLFITSPEIPFVYVHGRYG